MSGFSNDTRSGGSGKFANFKDGKIVTNIDGEKKTFTTLTGKIRGVYVEPAEYQGKPYTKVVVSVIHPGGETLLGFPLSSGYGKAFCCLLPSIDINKEVSISGGTTPDKLDPTKKYASMFMEQGGVSLKWFYSKANKNDDKIPAVEKVLVGSGRNKTEVSDYSKREDFFERLILAFDNKLEKAFGKYEKEKHDPAADITEPIDDQPF